MAEIREEMSRMDGTSIWSCRSSPIILKVFPNLSLSSAHTCLSLLTVEEGTDWLSSGPASHRTWYCTGKKKSSWKELFHRSWRILWFWFPLASDLSPNSSSWSPTTVSRTGAKIHYTALVVLCFCSNQDPQFIIPHPRCKNTFVTRKPIPSRTVFWHIFFLLAPG